MNIWTCKIGESGNVPSGGDAPMREAVAEAYREVTGEEAVFIFSGWAGSLTEGERAVLEDRPPRIEEPADVLERLHAEYNRRINDLIVDQAESDALRERMAELLRGTANALKGTPGPLQSHDWSDLPAVAAAVVAERDAALERLAAVEAVLADGKVTYSINNADDPDVRAGRKPIKVLTPMMTETDAIRAALAAAEAQP